MMINNARLVSTRRRLLAAAVAVLGLTVGAALTPGSLFALYDAGYKCADDAARCEAGTDFGCSVHCDSTGCDCVSGFF